MAFSRRFPSHSPRDLLVTAEIEGEGGKRGPNNLIFSPSWLYPNPAIPLLSEIKPGASFFLLAGRQFPNPDLDII